ncbi:hypothetical protein ABLE93_08695 [Xanthobacter sp. KR7-65]
MPHHVRAVAAADGEALRGIGTRFGARRGGGQHGIRQEVLDVPSDDLVLPQAPQMLGSRIDGRDEVVRVEEDDGIKRPAVAGYRTIRHLVDHGCGSQPPAAHCDLSRAKASRSLR